MTDLRPPGWDELWDLICSRMRKGDKLVWVTVPDYDNQPDERFRLEQIADLFDVPAEVVEDFGTDVALEPEEGQ